MLCEMNVHADTPAAVDVGTAAASFDQSKAKGSKVSPEARDLLQELLSAHTQLEPSTGDDDDDKRLSTLFSSLLR